MPNNINEANTTRPLSIPGGFEYQEQMDGATTVDVNLNGGGSPVLPSADHLLSKTFKSVPRKLLEVCITSKGNYGPATFCLGPFESAETIQSAIIAKQIGLTAVDTMYYGPSTETHEYRHITITRLPE